VVASLGFTSMVRARLQRIFLSVLFAGLFCARADAAEPQWIRVSSSHFAVLTDAGEKKGHEVAYRFEQMRSVFSQLLMKTKLNLPQPLEIVAFKTDNEYAQIAPLRQGQPISAAGFFLPGEDRNYIVLNLSADDSWRSVAHEFAHLMLNYNYPPTQSWFDEGFAEYFASIRLDDKQVQLGGDPDSLVELLATAPWQSIPDLFNTRHDTSSYQEGTHHTLFHAQSWMVMHYLLNQNKLAETGTYFGLVENEKMPVEQAIQKAYGMTPAQFDQAVEDYFHSLAPRFQAQAAAQPLGTTTIAGEPVHRFPTPLGPVEVGTSTQPIADGEARALVAEVMVRLPEHRDQGLQDLQSVISQPKLDNAIVHRALAWDHMQRKEFDQGTEELSRALELDPKDAWVRYYLALVKYHAAQSNGQQFQGLSNMMQDLRAVLDWNPEFAEAYSMLGMARVEGGGISSAMEAMRAAILLSPRNQQYLLNMAQIYMAGKKWDAALALLEQLKGSQNPQIAQAAQKNLADLPTLKKYGMLPTKEPEHPAQTAAPAAQPQHATEKQSAQKSEPASAEEPEPPAEPQPDRRKTQFLKGKLVSIDCAQAPVAVLTIAAGAKIVKLRTEDYKALLLIGEDRFSCEWKSRRVLVNYKAGGKADGDLVSLELQ
jgi:tetratricopeptide (TPR) repeat protein